MASVEQNRRLHGLLKETGLKEQKANLVGSFTGGRTTSSKEMSTGEMREMISYLNTIKTEQEHGKPTAPAQETEAQVSDRMRKKVFSLCYQMGYIYGEKPEDKTMNAAVIKRLVRNVGYLKPKELNAYTYSELPKLVSQFEKMQLNNAYQDARDAVVRLVDELNEEAAVNGGELC